MDKPIRNRIIMLDNEMNQISYSYISSSIVTDSARKKTIIDRHISEINIK